MAAKQGMSSLVRALDNPEMASRVFSRLTTIGRNYIGYIRMAAPVGATVGTLLGLAHCIDIQEDRKLSRKEILAYPVIGGVGGAFLGVSAPVWIIFAPIGYVFGYEGMSMIAKTLMAAVLLSDEKKEKKEIS